MHVRRWMIVGLLLTALVMRAAGTQDQHVTDSLKADSINAAASHPNFVKVWLVTVTPGTEGTSTYGHAALRLQCESEDLDYCFSFSMESDGISILKFVRGSTKGGFQSVTSETFLNRYKQEGRGISQIQLNLLPQEEQELWRLLDHEVEQGPRWNYNFISTSCTSMCIWAVESCLDKEHIEYHQLDPILNANYAEVLHSMSADSPWLELLLNMRFFNRRHETGDLNEKFSPDLLMSSWEKAFLINNEGMKRPMTVGERQILCQADALLAPHRPFLTPSLVLTALCIVLIGVCSIFLLKRKK